jgi:hypothetical protein
MYLRETGRQEATSVMATKTETLRIVQFDEESKALMQEIGETLRDIRSFWNGVESEMQDSLREVSALLTDFRRVASFDISEEVTDDGETATFTFADLE